MKPDGLCIYEAGRPHECHWTCCESCPVYKSHNIAQAIADAKVEAVTPDE